MTAHSEPVHGGPVGSIKQGVGLLGRADFFTAPNRIGADLVWWDEKVAVWIMNCVWHGCPTHSSQAIPSWKERIEAFIANDAMVDETLKNMGWLALRFFECQAASDPRMISEQIIAALGNHEVKVPELIAQEMEGEKHSWARIARIDACSRSTDEHWTEFLRVIRESGTRFRRGDLHAYLVAEKGWPDDVFDQLWRVAQHHEVISYDSNGFMKGSIFGAVVEDAGLTN